MKRLGSTLFCLMLSACTGVVSSPTPQQDPGGQVTGSPPAVTAPAGICGNAGHVGPHRLNRVEYVSSVRDVLGIDPLTIDVGFLPQDREAGDFTNIAEKYDVSQENLGQYLDVADKVVTQALSSARDKLMFCDRASLGDSACLTETVRHFATLAFRRPPAEDMLADLMRLTDVADYEGSVRRALQAILVSPYFIYRVVLPKAGSERGLDGYELATRLSYALWASTPDQELLTLASNGSLSDAAVLEQQVTRLLGDPRSAGFVQGFGLRYFGLHRLEQRSINQAVFPSYSDQLKADFFAETSAFLGHLLQQNRPITDLFTADYSFVNGRLSQHYGLPAPVTGDAFQQVSLVGTTRRGIMGQGSVLMMTSNPDESSVIKRGYWGLKKLLCMPPMAPPDGLDLRVDVPENASPREYSNARLAKSPCNGCHVHMDPIGFGLENFDAIGRYRSSYADGRPIDSQGKLQDGASFSGALELSSLLASRGEVIVDCVSERLLEYSLGRELSEADQCVVDSMIESAKRGADATVTFSDLIVALVQSVPFRNQEAL